ncbi:MAG: hypothetical protein A3J79_05715 [Elusimicrobia bacterium RIFOXYB2_FULL_62_6]|nr:MAG: hypothetical protein A3J79_05715 [Elusimicrobia bacterium RIFOXYB2_FULL_62_6]
MKLSKTELERYARQIIVPGIGVKGQEKLKKSAVLVAGSGGLGGPVSAYLAAAGVGRLGLADFGDLELSNLNRQVFFRTRDIGRPKSSLLAARLKELNPNVKFEPLTRKLDAANLAPLLKKYSLVLDCTDNFTARLAINEACFRAGRPFVHGAVYGFEGQLAVFDPRRGPCLRCAFPHTPPPPAGPVPVPGPVPGALGALQAAEALKLLCGLPVARGRLLIYDLAHGMLHTVPLKKIKRCPVCGGK